MSTKMFAIAAFIGLLLVGSMFVFTVKETEKALKLYLGQVVYSEYKPGLHFKVPIFNEIRKFDARIQTVDEPAQQFLTSEQKNLIVDSFIKWRIENVETYFTSVSGSELNAGQRLSEIVADGLRSEFGKRTIQDVVSGERTEIMDIITQAAKEGAEKFGIEVIDVRIKQIELPKDVRTSVFQRMETAREQVAKELRSRGEAEAIRIRASADRESAEVLAHAKRDAEKTRGEGDAIAADTYAQAYGNNTEFYTLYRSLNAYKQAFSNRNDMLLLQPNTDFFKYFNSMRGTEADLATPSTQ